MRYERKSKDVYKIEIKMNDISKAMSRNEILSTDSVGICWMRDLSMKLKNV